MSARQSPEGRQSEFVSRIAPDSHFDRLLDHLPGVSFFLKNERSEIMKANRAFVTRFGFQDEREIIGKTDFDLFPPHLAEHFRVDDRKVIEAGQPLLNLVELFFNQQGLPDWYVTNKLPVFSREGSVIGVMGTVQSYAGKRRVLQPYLAISRAVDFINERFRDKISVQDLARMVHLSIRQFDRKFKETFNLTPQEFILKTRVQAACEALRAGGEPISQIATDCGFYDQSSFTHHFRKHMGMTPLQYRKQYHLARRSR